MSSDGGKGLSRTSSFVINSATKSSTPATRPAKIVVETVPDSQEESVEKSGLYKGDVIDLSSESDSENVKKTPTSGRPPLHVSDSDPFLSPSRNVPSTSTKPSFKEVIEESSADDDSDEQPHYLPRITSSRRAVISDSEDKTEREQEQDSLQDERDADPDNDGAILILNDPPSSRKPAVRGDGASPSKSKRPPVSLLVHSSSSVGQIKIADPSPAEATELRLPKRVPGTQAVLPDYFTPKSKLRKKVMKGSVQMGTMEPSSSTTTASVTPSHSKPVAKRRTKKVIEQEKQAHLASYAQALFDELNASVFKGRLPKETLLVWNKRLLATAGRAKWHRDSKGVVTTSIELATKVLDCEERIRNTLSHEMCHLACWVINCNPKENHGRVWQGWVDEVMEKRPDISISTKHTYDIQYKYEWQCQTATCKKIYGRFSNSIDPARNICGVCKVGELVPLFKIRTRKAKITSNMAAGKPRDSPMLSALWPGGAETPTHSPLKNKLDDGAILVTSDTESDGERLSGEDTDVEDRPGVTKVVMKPKTSKTNTRKDQDTEHVRKLMTHMSIIDLTDD